MPSKSANKPRLSKGILEMKFMQRTKAKVKKEIEAAEGRAMYSSEITDKMLNNNSNFIIEPSFVHCEDLIEGRLSFRGMNPEIERLLELENAERDAAKRNKQSVDVSNEEMAKFYYSNKTPTDRPTQTIPNKVRNHNKVRKSKRQINEKVTTVIPDKKKKSQNNEDQ